ncbi:A24 family peptidase C-terminal domain-containing protein [Thermococcus sp.]|uniref:A24 family peptidase C-terminal domain-containing protein n=1 Tax=Thermococcus sp. TaxID=35749 RepID=UPI002637E44F|nr:A24 family peptidase C-terminal domain-containing protein [Thermococcus sp.]
MEHLPLILGVLAGVLTSYTDLKTGFILDNHVFPTLSLVGRLLGWDEEEDVDLPRWIGRVVIPAAEGGVLYYAYRGISEGNPGLAAAGLVGLVIGFLLGVALYYFGVWASGDAVLLAGFSALLPLPPGTAKVVPPYALSLPLYPLTILLNSILAVFPFILAYALAVLLVRRPSGMLREILIGKPLTVLQMWLWLVGSAAVTLVLPDTGLKIPGYLLGFFLLLIFVRFRMVGNVAGVLGLAYLIHLNPAAGFRFAGITLLLVYVTRVIIALFGFIRREVLVEEVTVQELREWDVLGETILDEKGRVRRDRSGPLERLWGFLKGESSSGLGGGRVIASPTAEGLTKEQIEELGKLVEDGKLENRFLRKKAMPFAPALFIGFLMGYFWGDVFWWLVLKVAGFS